VSARRTRYRDVGVALRARGARKAVRIANRAAGIVVGKFGTAVVEPHELLATNLLKKY